MSRSRAVYDVSVNISMAIVEKKRPDRSRASYSILCINDLTQHQTDLSSSKDANHREISHCKQRFILYNVLYSFNTKIQGQQ